MKKYLLVCFVLGLNSLVLWAQSEWNAEGNGKGKTVKTKKENIKYSYHVGSALLKTGLTLMTKITTCPTIILLIPSPTNANRCLYR